MAIIVEDMKDLEAFKNLSPSLFMGEEPVAQAPAEIKVEPSESKQGGQQPQQEQQRAQPVSTGERKFISPLAKKTASEKGIDYSQVLGTGPNGRIINADILEFSPKEAGIPIP